MANYFVSYDLNGDVPTHAEMDKHMEGAGWARGRILETVWYVGCRDPIGTVFEHVNSILSKNDSLIVIEASDASFRDLLVDDESLQQAWADNS